MQTGPRGIAFLFKSQNEGYPSKVWFSTLIIVSHRFSKREKLGFSSDVAIIVVWRSGLFFSSPLSQKKHKM
jgi:hypothetical protein